MSHLNLLTCMILTCSRGKPFKRESVKHIQELGQNFDLVDIWRIRNPESERFTWRQRDPFIQRRLDYWLISAGMLAKLTETRSVFLEV